MVAKVKVPRWALRWTAGFFVLSLVAVIALVVHR
jgi:hypothetical protein